MKKKSIFALGLLFSCIIISCTSLRSAHGNKTLTEEADSVLTKYEWEEVREYDIANKSELGDFLRFIARGRNSLAQSKKLKLWKLGTVHHSKTMPLNGELSIDANITDTKKHHEHDVTARDWLYIVKALTAKPAKVAAYGKYVKKGKVQKSAYTMYLPHLDTKNNLIVVALAQDAKNDVRLVTSYSQGWKYVGANKTVKYVMGDEKRLKQVYDSLHKAIWK